MIDPLSAATSGKSAISRMSFHIGLQLTSVLAPGIVVTAEIALLAAGFLSRGEPEEVGDAMREVSEIHGTGLILLVLIGSAAGYVVGWISRELGFWMVGLLEALRTRGTSRERAAIVSLVRRWTRSGPERARSASTDVAATPTHAADELPVGERLRLIMGDDAVDDCMRHHPILAILERDGDGPGGALRTKRHWSSSVPFHEMEAFIYCKLWLRRFVPDFSVEWIELDINILTSALIPLGLLYGNLVAWGDYPGWIDLLCLPPFVGVLILLVHNVARKRDGERWEAVRNLVEDHTMRVALSAYPSPYDTDVAGS